MSAKDQHSGLRPNMVSHSGTVAVAASCAIPLIKDFCELRYDEQGRVAKVSRRSLPVELRVMEPGWHVGPNMSHDCVVP